MSGISSTWSHILIETKPSSLVFSLDIVRPYPLDMNISMQGPSTFFKHPQNGPISRYSFQIQYDLTSTINLASDKDDMFLRFTYSLFQIKEVFKQDCAECDFSVAEVLLIVSRSFEDPNTSTCHGQVTSYVPPPTEPEKQV